MTADTQSITGSKMETFRNDVHEEGLHLDEAIIPESFRPYAEWFVRGSENRGDE